MMLQALTNTPNARISAMPTFMKRLSAGLIPWMLPAISSAAL